MKVGIDLGTTNSAVAYVDEREAETEFPPVHIQPVPQYVRAGSIEPRRTLPSFLYLGDQQYVGVWAREQGALVPTRLVHSAKSWLSNPEVDRRDKILPWDSQETGRVLSPVEVSARYLGHMREAWDQAHPQLPLSGQDIVLTVPASFDEEARELTVEAARDAGLEKLTLLEEPAAAFYSWISTHLKASRSLLFDGQTVLVVDVGGGTSDFTLIRVAREGDRVEFTRTAVGRHLLLGGDNLDLTLAWLAETKLGKQLSIRQRSALRRQCTAAKERLLTEAHLEKVKIQILGAGTSLIGGAMETEILREEAVELTLEGFLPLCDRADRPAEDQRSLFRELGLPYVSDPAVTRHLAAFLEGVPEGPDAVLFNGGFFIPELCRTRVADALERWYGRRPVILENHDLDLAVAVGAAYYSFVRATGTGVVVRGGLPRTYYIGIDGGADRIRTVCLVPRGSEEGSTLEVDREDLQLVANRPVAFRLYSSLIRTEDRLAEVVEFAPDDADLHQHAPLQAVIRFGKRTGERLIPVSVGARLTEVGTLDLWCQSKVSDHRWRLEFQLRKTVEPDRPGPPKPVTVISSEALERALALLREAFVSLRPEELPGKLEATLGLGKNSWPLGTIRTLADTLLELADGRRRTAGWESRWLNLCGFCLRPGFGYPGDDLRVSEARRVWSQGLVFPNQVQCEIDWWIFWGRVAGGLNRNQQVDLYQRLAATLLAKKPPRINEHLLREMWRTACSLELLPSQTRIDLGNALAKRVQAADCRENELWCLSRLGARRLFYGPANQVLPPAPVARWVDVLLPIPKAAEAVALMARRTGDLSRDLPAPTLELVRRTLAQRDDAVRLLRILEGEAPHDAQLMERIFGEELPSGLVTTGESR
jgi:molecular chaperone DnaK (HSP70)